MLLFVVADTGLDPYFADLISYFGGQIVEKAVVLGPMPMMKIFSLNTRG